MDISIIICCYNSENLIKETLRYISNQETQKEIEVILVDNNCNDDTVLIAKSTWSNLGSKFPLKIVREPKPGLSNARKKGFNESSASIIIFCDDDNWLDSKYCDEAYRQISGNNRIGIIGGLIKGVLESEEPEWWQEKCSGYAVGRQAESSGDITQRGYVWGAGMVIRKEILTRIYSSGFESLLTGRNQKMLSSGDDSEICKWAILLGFKLYYNEGLRVSHFITKPRLNIDYLNYLEEGHRNASKILNIYDFWIQNYGWRRNSKIKWLYAIYYLLIALFKQDDNAKLRAQLQFGSRIKIHDTLHKIICFSIKLNR